MGVALRDSLLSLCFLSGYYSKDSLLEAGISQSWGLLPLFTFYGSVGLTVTYSFRIWLSINGARYTATTLCSMLSAGPFSKLPVALLLISFLYQSQILSCDSQLFLVCLSHTDMVVL